MINIFMSKKFVFVECDVYCQGWTNPPSYRAFVNNELFTERTWIWPNMHLEECFQILANPGKYYIRYELLPGTQASIQLLNWRVITGPGSVNSSGLLEIHE